MLSLQICSARRHSKYAAARCDDVLTDTLCAGVKYNCVVYLIQTRDLLAGLRMCPDIQPPP